MGERNKREGSFCTTIIAHCAVPCALGYGWNGI